MTSFGLLTIDLAMDTRCCSPPDNSVGNMRTLCFKPTNERTSITFFLISLGSHALLLQGQMRRFQIQSTSATA